MKPTLILSLAALALAGAAFGAAKHAPAAHAKPAVIKPAAQQAAEEWLSMMDCGGYEECYDDAATLFRSQLTSDQWVKAVSSVRSPLGALKSRTLKTIRYTKTLPGAPDGDYAVIQYHTVFAKKASAIETITPMKDSDGTWRVSGYFIR